MTPAARVALWAEIVRGLSATPKTLPSALLYDALGSALFEAITFLPEYGVAAADRRMIDAHAGDVVARLPGALDVVELGPGGGAKSSAYLGEIVRREGAAAYAGVDVSASAMEATRAALATVAGVVFTGVQDRFLDGLRRAPRNPDPAHRRLVLFLGSNLSNFDRTEGPLFLRGVRGALRPGDALLLATDLDKDPALLVPAYDDALGVTAAFNRNVLVRLRHEWGAEVPLDAFVHEVRWNAAQRRVEMHLRARRPCTLVLDGNRFDFCEGETVRTEMSHRFACDELRAWGAGAGFTCAAQWTDSAWAFAHTLLVAE